MKTSARQGFTLKEILIVTAIIAVARSLNLRVIGEGVETLRQMEVLHRLGCSLMQGFLFSKPQPPEDIETWLQQTILPRKAPWIGQVEEATAAESPSPRNSLRLLPVPGSPPVAS